MKKSKYKLVIFESNKDDGIMSRNKKFYSKELSQEKINECFLKTRIKLGEKYHFDGKKIFQPCQKDVKYIEDYPDGKYIKISKENLSKEDYWYEEIPADIIMIDKNYPNIVIGHQMADCPVVIAEDRKQQIVALAHCGALQINREITKKIIEALKTEKSKPEDIYVYIGSCAKKKSYQYDCYPKWATKEDVWKDSIIKKENTYYIDMIKAIKKQLHEQKINHIKESPIDTYTSPKYYSHIAEVKGNQSKVGQNFVGCFYQEKES